MRSVGVREAKDQFCRLLAGVEAGEEVVITRSGKAVACLAPLAPAARKLGLLAGRYTVPDDWDAPLPPEAFNLPASAQRSEPASSLVRARRSALPSISTGHALECEAFDNAGLFELLDDADLPRPDEA